MTSAPKLDKRLTPARPDLAAAFLRGQVAAAQFVTGTLMRVMEEAIALRSDPAPDAALQTQALYGEDVMVYEDHEGWAWGQLVKDGYVGYMPANALRATQAVSTHRVIVPRSFAYPDANMKMPVLTALPMGARVSVIEERGAFSRTCDHGFVVTRHLSSLISFAQDYVAIAEMFLHVPYLWGGKTSMGLDCSGLLQVALAAGGLFLPRDSDMLESAIGTTVDAADSLAGLQRGDLVFWKGHCGIMRDATTLLHANAHHMLVASEPLIEARDRILDKNFGAITSIRRPKGGHG